MNGFQKTVLMVALIILTVTLAIIGVLLYNNQTEIKFHLKLAIVPITIQQMKIINAKIHLT